MIYNVFGGTLSLTQSINQYLVFASRRIERLHVYTVLIWSVNHSRRMDG